MKRHVFIAGLIVLIILTLPASVRAQAPAPDSYEENDTLSTASAIELGADLENLTISPADDADWFRVLIAPPATYAGQYRVEVIGTLGLDLALTVYGPDSSPVASDNDPGGPNAAIAFQANGEGWYALEVLNATTNEGWYVLRITDETPAPTSTTTSTPLPTATGSPLPTATPPAPTITVTSDLGGTPDYTEPNYDFAHAYRVVPGDLLTGLNFNAGSPDAIDNDFFVMAVRYGITYTCQTEDLGPAVDTNLIAYHSASTDDLIAGNDDIDTQSGQINSRVTFTAAREGDIYLLVGYKYPQPQGLPYPGAATYTLRCQASTPTPTSTAMPAFNGTWKLTPQTTPLHVELLSRPETVKTPTPVPLTPQTVDVLVGYDRNANGQVDPNEGVRGISVRVINTVANRQLSHGFTDQNGSVRFIVVSAAPIRVSIPFLGAAEDFRTGSPVQWTLLIPAANAPGLIP